MLCPDSGTAQERRYVKAWHDSGKAGERVEKEEEGLAYLYLCGQTRTRELTGEGAEHSHTT